ncbi:MAG: hypothetical protein K1X92_02155 [Bacteroidia bacterium]|nr:hypothetical protein [Bacteroidia bacterium]
MSEYQVYEFQTIDRALTAEERAEINKWSSRAKVSSHKAVFTYSYGDFRQDEEKVTFQYFDAMLYWANFGIKKLIFRFPLGSIDKKAIIPYTFSDNIELKSDKNHILLIFSESVEEGGYDEWIEEDSSILSDMTGIRNAIMEGDYRALYIAWLYFHSEYSQAYFDEDYYEQEDGQQSEWENLEGVERVLAIKRKVSEPPVPAGLNQLNADLQCFASFLGLPEEWIQAAATVSQDIKENMLDLPDLIAKLTEAEKNDFLLRLARQELNLSKSLLNKLTLMADVKKQPPILKARKVQEIADIAAELLDKKRRR